MVVPRNVPIWPNVLHFQLFLEYSHLQNFIRHTISDGNVTEKGAACLLWHDWSASYLLTHLLCLLVQRRMRLTTRATSAWSSSSNGSKRPCVQLAVQKRRAMRSNSVVVLQVASATVDELGHLVDVFDARSEGAAARRRRSRLG